jgi:FkbM family methyltransferase
MRLGSCYGGWTFEVRPSLRNAPIISCGLGEDVSFDVEMARAFGCRVILVDPTPRAIVHYERVVARLGKPAERAYADGGDQPPEAYDLRALAPANFELVPKALWTCEGKVRFYEPEVATNVSHSLLRNQGVVTDRYIELEAVRLDTVLRQYGIDSLPLLKLDIEGAETEVLRDMLDAGILPEQVLVEFDHLLRPGPDARREVEALDGRLRAAGYHCLNFDGTRNYLYALPRDRASLTSGDDE